jgi:hypothetical protein
VAAKREGRAYWDSRSLGERMARDRDPNEAMTQADRPPD